jgi:hypothetical protein
LFVAHANCRWSSAICHRSFVKYHKTIRHSEYQRLKVPRFSLNQSISFYQSINQCPPESIQSGRHSRIHSILAFMHCSIHAFFSILTLASTARISFSLPSNGLISNSFISVAKRSKLESRTTISANFGILTPACLLKAFQNFVRLQAFYHRQCLIVRKRCKSRCHIFQHFNINSAHSANHNMPEFLFVTRTQKKFRSRCHLSDQNTFGTLNSMQMMKFFTNLRYIAHIQNNPTNFGFCVPVQLLSLPPENQCSWLPVQPRFQFLQQFPLPLKYPLHQATGE